MTVTLHGSTKSHAGTDLLRGAHYQRAAEPLLAAIEIADITLS
jgi:hypothetical protein